MAIDNTQMPIRADILRKLIILLEPWLNNDVTVRINEQTGLITNLGLDSVAIMQLILEIEEEFNIYIKSHEIDSNVFSRIGNLIDLIEGKINATS